jgi:hypothetical protein
MVNVVLEELATASLGMVPARNRDGAVLFLAKPQKMNAIRWAQGNGNKCFFTLSKIEGDITDPNRQLYACGAVGEIQSVQEAGNPSALRVTVSFSERAVAREFVVRNGIVFALSVEFQPVSDLETIEVDRDDMSALVGQLYNLAIHREMLARLVKQNSWSEIEKLREAGPSTLRPICQMALDSQDSIFDFIEEASSSVYGSAVVERQEFYELQTLSEKVAALNQRLEALLREKREIEGLLPKK